MTLIVFFFYISISLEALSPIQIPNTQSFTSNIVPCLSNISYSPSKRPKNMALRALVTLLFVPLFLSPTILGYSQADIKKWCSQTPNPEPCEYFLSHNPNYHNPIKQKSHFFTISKQLALERV